MPQTSQVERVTRHVRITRGPYTGASLSVVFQRFLILVGLGLLVIVVAELATGKNSVVDTIIYGIKYSYTIRTSNFAKLENKFISS